MKKIILFLMVCFAIPSFGQTEYGSHTLFKTREKNVVNAYISFDGLLTSMGDKTAWGIGATIGVTTNGSFTVGLTGTFLFDPRNMDSIYSAPPDYRITTYCGWGGFFIEPVLFHKFPFHLTVPATICVGGMSYVMKSTDYYSYWSLNHQVLDNSVFVVLTIGARLELNVVKNFRISCGPSYRYVPNLRIMNTPPDLLNGLSLDLSLKFGEY